MEGAELTPTCSLPLPGPAPRAGRSWAHFAAAHGAHALHQLPRLQLEGSAALHLLVPQFYSASFFGPKKDQEELSMSVVVLRPPTTLAALSPWNLIRATATRSPVGLTLHGGPPLGPADGPAQPPKLADFPKCLGRKENRNLGNQTFH